MGQEGFCRGEVSKYVPTDAGSVALRCQERPLSWLNRFRRLKVRYERRADIHQAFLTLGCSLICWHTLNRSSGW